MREPIANKTHYSNGVLSLDKQITESYENERGPGTIPVKMEKLATPEANLPVKAIIVPHAPIDLAGPCASWAYKDLAEQGEGITTYIIIAQPQKSLKSGTTLETFQMPHGEIRVDQQFVRDLVSKGHIKVDEQIHKEESVIEVQLPYLQHLNKNRLEKIKIVPLLIGDDVDYKELSADIKEVLLEQNKQALFIFVTNLTSYGRNFHFVPFTEEIPQNIAKIDKSLIDAIKSHKEKNFFEAVDKSMVPVSGYFAMKLYFTLLNPKKISLEQNYLSGDVNGDYKNCVSYASFVIR